MGGPGLRRAACSVVLSPGQTIAPANFYVLGKYLEAEKLYKPALAIFEKARPSAATTRDLAKTLNGLGRVYEHEGRYARLDRATPPARRHSSKPTFSKRTTSLQESTTQ
jgi:tetratricopeptide (TPR) repeat protein